MCTCTSDTMLLTILFIIANILKYYDYYRNYYYNYYCQYCRRKRVSSMAVDATGPVALAAIFQDYLNLNSTKQSNCNIYVSKPEELQPKFDVWMKHRARIECVKVNRLRKLGTYSTCFSAFSTKYCRFGSTVSSVLLLLSSVLSFLLSIIVLKEWNHPILQWRRL